MRFAHLEAEGTRRLPGTWHALQVQSRGWFCCGLTTQEDGEMAQLPDSQTYRIKAIEARNKADTKSDADVRETLLQIAADYESMANTLEALRRSEDTLKRLDENSD